MKECFKREFGVRLRTGWLFSVLKVPCVMRGGTVVGLTTSRQCCLIQEKDGFEMHSWPVQSEQKGSHLLLARRPPSFMLDVLLYGRHWGLSPWRLVQFSCFT